MRLENFFNTTVPNNRFITNNIIVIYTLYLNFILECMNPDINYFINQTDNNSNVEIFETYLQKNIQQIFI